MNIHVIAADIANRRKAFAEDSAENVEQIVLGMLQSENEATQKILSSCGATSVQHLRDKYLDALRYANQQHLPAEFKSWEDVFKHHAKTAAKLKIATETLEAIDRGESFPNIAGIALNKLKE